MLLAFTHELSPRMELCERTYVPRTSIDRDLAVQQHDAYCAMLRQCGADVRVLSINRDLPDCVFIEDTAVILDEVAVLASMGAASRRAEPAGIESELREYREVHRVDQPATLEGGDVLRIGRTLLIGVSSRTNRAGVNALEGIARRHGYRVVPVPVRQCLHLKTACTALPDRRLLLNPGWLEMEALRGFEWLRVPEDEPWAGNVLLAGDRVCLDSSHAQTADLIRGLGFEVRAVDLSEFAKAEGGVTCLSLPFDQPAVRQK